MSKPKNDFDHCFECGARTIQRKSENGDEATTCPKCGWQPVRVMWFGTAREPVEVEA